VITPNTVRREADSRWTADGQPGLKALAAEGQQFLDLRYRRGSGSVFVTQPMALANRHPALHRTAARRFPSPVRPSACWLQALPTHGLRPPAGSGRQGSRTSTAGGVTGQPALSFTSGSFGPGSKEQRGARSILNAFAGMAVEVQGMAAWQRLESYDHRPAGSRQAPRPSAAARRETPVLAPTLVVFGAARDDATKSPGAAQLILRKPQAGGGSVRGPDTPWNTPVHARSVEKNWLRRLAAGSHCGSSNTPGG